MWVMHIEPGQLLAYVLHAQTDRAADKQHKSRLCIWAFAMTRQGLTSLEATEGGGVTRQHRHAQQDNPPATAPPCMGEVGAVPAP